MNGGYILSEKIKLTNAKRKEKWNILSYKDSTSEILKSFRIEITGNSFFSLEGCQRVEEYTEEYLKLKLQKGGIFLHGKELNITSFEDKTITVKGEIKALEFFI